MRAGAGARAGAKAVARVRVARVAGEGEGGEGEGGEHGDGRREVRGDGGKANMLTCSCPGCVPR